MIQDLRYALRLLLKNPGFSLIAIVTLALGTGANTAIFSLINSAILRPLPVEKPNQLVAVNNTSQARMFPSFSNPNYRDFRDRNTVFSGLLAYRFVPLNLSHDGVNERLWGYEVTGNYFELLGVRTARGRALLPSDDEVPGGHPVAVISYQSWQQRFGAAEDIIGKEVIVNGRSYTIVGVAPQGFYGTEVIAAPDMWFPVAMQSQLEMGTNWLENRESENLLLQGRLKPGVSTGEADANLNSIALQLEQEFPNINEGKRISISAPGMIGGAMKGPVLGFFAILMAVVALVLLLTCTNLANLLIARANERRKEIAVRLAVGASRFRVVRQLLTEGLLLAVAGGALGLLLASWLADLARTFKPPIDVPLAINLHLDYRVFVFTFILCLVAALLFGLVPALQATRTDLVPALKDEVAFGGRRRSLLKSGLIVMQVALSLVLLVAGGLMIKALQQAQRLDLGFDPQDAVEVSFDLRLQGYEPGPGREFQKRLLERVRALPEVRYAGIADLVPVDLHFSRDSVFVDGRPADGGTKPPSAFVSRVSPGYFQSMNTRLVQGRDFSDQDDQNTDSVVIVNETFANQFFQGQDPIGKHFALGNATGTKRRIIGVAQRGKYAGLSEDPKPFVYRAIFQSYSGATSVVARTAGDPHKMISAVRNEVQQLDPNIALSSRTLVERMSMPLLPARLAAAVLGGFGVLALALSAIGIYGVMAFSVSTRTREVGIRMALGAQNRDILTLVIRQALILTLVGVSIGLSSALVLTRLMKSLLFGVSATDLATFAGASVLLGGVALLACYIPARRAMSVDPLTALRHE